MKWKKYQFGVVILLLLLLWPLHSQTPNELLKIIGSESRIELRQAQIDSFLRASKDTTALRQLADMYHDLGSKWHFINWLKSKKVADLENAIQVTQNAIGLKRRAKNLEDCSLNKSLYNLGVFLSLDNKIYDAIEVYEQLIEKGRKHCDAVTGNKDKILPARLRLGELYLITGEFYRAIDSYSTSVAAMRPKNTMSQQDFRELVYAHLQLANLYYRINTKDYFDKIDKHLEHALTVLKISDIPCCQYQMDINQQYGNAFLEIKNYREALRYHKAALQEVCLNDSLNLAIINNSLGISYFNLGQDTLALESFDNAIAYNGQYPDPYNNLGDCYSKKENFKDAIKNYQKAIDLAIGNNVRFPEDSIPAIEDLELVPEKISLLNHIVTKANGWINYYEHDGNHAHLAHALETFTLADQLVDLIRFESTEYQSKLYWREQGSSLFMKAVEVCHLLNRPEEAFHFMERNKALLLLEDLTNEEAKEIANLPNKAAEREFNLKRKIFLSENSLQEADDANQEIITHLKDIILENKYRYEQFVDSLNEAYPDYAKFKKKVEVLAFKDLKTNYISDNKAVLHYILNEEQGYGLLTLADTTLLFQMDDIPKLNKNVEALIATISNGLSDIQTFQKISNTVFRQLLPENSYDKIKGKQLTIVPDYTLQRIPFEALVVNKEEPKYLIEDVEIGYAYSMSLLYHTKGKEKGPKKDLLAFAPVQFDGLGLPQLYFSENEITGIADVYPGETLINGQATKANFLENVDGHKIVHLATHADIGDGENPWIAFSDSKMYLKEIYATRNQADMVVLSACNTSNGALKRGEGVMSLARGFFYSGAKSVVSTLWPVADEAGKDILIGFYENLDQGDSKSKALQKAKLAYLKTTEEVELEHPYYWAGFIIVGDNSPMVTKSYWYWVLLAMGLLVLLFLLFRGNLFKGFQ